MGGQGQGDEASLAGVYAIDCFRQALSRREGREESVQECVQAANEAICTRNREHHREMGSTFLLAVVDGEGFLTANLGDSRAYLWAQGQLRQVSKDHTEAQSLLDMGLIRTLPPKDGKLTQHLGIPAQEMLLEPYLARGELRRGDRLLLCSDGLTDMVSPEEIARILQTGADPDEQAAALADRAEVHGGRDNITALVVAVEAEEDA